MLQYFHLIIFSFCSAVDICDMACAERANPLILILLVAKKLNTTLVSWMKTLPKDVLLNFVSESLCVNSPETWGLDSEIRKAISCKLIAFSQDKCVNLPTRENQSQKWGILIYVLFNMCYVLTWSIHALKSPLSKNLIDCVHMITTTQLPQKLKIVRSSYSEPQ